MDNTTRTDYGPDGAFHSVKKALKNSALEAEKLGSEVSDKTEQMATDFEGKAKGYLQSGTAYVKDKPIRSLAYIALGGALAGGLLTLFMGRKSSKK